MIQTGKGNRVETEMSKYETRADSQISRTSSKPSKKRKLSSANTTGYRGVYNHRKKFKAILGVDRKSNYLGTYGTAKEAALAYDRAVVQHKLPSSKLNFPNDYNSSSDDENSAEESDGCSAVAGDDESDVEPEHVPSPRARPCFERDPMLDRLFAEQQNKNKTEKGKEVCF